MLRSLPSLHAPSKRLRRQHEQTSPTPLVLAIDIEPAPRHDVIGSEAEWSGFLECVKLLAPWREWVREQTGNPLRVSWFLRMDDQIEQTYGSMAWIRETFGDLIEELASEGDDFGIHSHAYRRAGDAWVQDYTDEARIGTMLDAAVAAFTDGMGSRPRAFRFGDHWLSEETLAHLEHLGFEYDLTLEPGRRGGNAPGSDAGSFPDYTRAPREPYRPRRASFLQVGDAEDHRGIWMLPVSMSCYRRPGPPHPRFHPGHRYEQANLALSQAFMQPFIDYLLGSDEKLISIASRTGDLSHPAYEANFRANLAYLLGHPDIARVVVEPPAEAIVRITAADALALP